MTLIGLAMVLLALVGGLLILLRPARRSKPEDRDQAVLEEAEREVRELGSMQSPEDAHDQLKDWGPGAPQ